MLIEELKAQNRLEGHHVRLYQQESNTDEVVLGGGARLHQLKADLFF